VRERLHFNLGMARVFAIDYNFGYLDQTWIRSSKISELIGATVLLGDPGPEPMLDNTGNSASLERKE
jgi:hypothetical protein